MGWVRRAGERGAILEGGAGSGESARGVVLAHPQGRRGRRSTRGELGPGKQRRAPGQVGASGLEVRTFSHKSFP